MADIKTIAFDDLWNEQELWDKLGVCSKQGHSAKDQVKKVWSDNKGIGQCVPAINFVGKETDHCEAVTPSEGKGIDQCGPVMDLGQKGTDKSGPMVDPGSSLTDVLYFLSSSNKKTDSSSDKDLMLLKNKMEDNDVHTSNMAPSCSDGDDGFVIDIQERKKRPRPDNGGQQVEKRESETDKSIAQENSYPEIEAPTQQAQTKANLFNEGSQQFEIPETKKRTAQKRPHPQTEIPFSSASCWRALRHYMAEVSDKEKKRTVEPKFISFNEKKFSDLLNLVRLPGNGVVSRGFNGEVMKVWDIVTQERLVQKTVREVVENEILIPLQFCEENCFANVYGLGTNGTDTMIVQEDAGISLWQLIFSDQLLVLKEPGRIEMILLDLFRGISVLAEHGITHSDIKPENVCLCPKTLRAKLIDFGSCKTKQDDVNHSGITLEYLPPYTVYKILESGDGSYPELFMPRLTHKDDVWAAGLVALFLLIKAHPMIMWVTGNPIYTDTSGGERKRVISEIIKLCDQPDPNDSTQIPVKGLIKQLLDTPNYTTKQPNVEMLLEHVLVVDEANRWTAAKAVNFLEECLGLVPNYSKKAKMQPENEEEFVDLKQAKADHLQGKPVCPVPESPTQNDGPAVGPQLGVALKEKRGVKQPQQDMAPQSQGVALPQTQPLRTPTPQQTAPQIQPMAQPQQQQQHMVPQMATSAQLAQPPTQWTEKPSKPTAEGLQQGVIQVMAWPTQLMAQQQQPRVSGMATSSQLAQMSTQSTVQPSQDLVQGLQQEVPQQMTSPAQLMALQQQCMIPQMATSAQLAQPSTQWTAQRSQSTHLWPQQGVLQQMVLPKQLMVQQQQMVCQPQQNIPQQVAPPPQLPQQQQQVQRVAAPQPLMANQSMYQQAIPDASRQHLNAVSHSNVVASFSSGSTQQVRGAQFRSLQPIQPRLAEGQVQPGTSGQQPLTQHRGANVSQQWVDVRQPGTSRRSGSSRQAQTITTLDQFTVKGLFGGSITFETLPPKKYEKKKKPAKK